jgi:hypothetical protein
MDKVLGGDVEKGLAQLKTVAEGRRPVTDQSSPDRRYSGG